ncbi:hypothetical protein LCGC14_2349550, partial [marine sediment metagenome]
MNKLAARQTIFDALGYKPSKEQELFHFWDIEHPEIKTKLVAGGWRGGKSYSAEKELISRMLESGAGGLFWLVAEDYETSRDAEFKYLINDTLALGLTKDRDIPTSRVGPWELRLPRRELDIIIKNKSLQDLGKIGVEAPNGILVCEAARVPAEALMLLRGRLIQNDGWMLLSGTFDSSLGWYAAKFTEYQVPNADFGKIFSLPTW